MVVNHTFKLRTWDAKAVRSPSLKPASLVYKVSSRTARATKKNPVLKRQKNKKTKQQKKNKKIVQVHVTDTGWRSYD